MKAGPGKPPVPGVCLVILDGWGLAEPGPGTPWTWRDTPVFDELWDGYEHSQLTACGRAVGLPEGQMGNSEVGHLNLGAGQVVRQDLTRIDDAIEDGSFSENRVLRDACAAARERRARAPARPGLARRSALEHGPPEGADRPRRQGGRAGHRAPRVHRRPRHAARLGRGVRGGGRGVAGRGRGAGGQRERPLLRDGSRPPLGPHEARDGRAAARRGRGAPRRDGRAGRARRL